MLQDSTEMTLQRVLKCVVYEGNKQHRYYISVYQIILIVFL